MVNVLIEFAAQAEYRAALAWYVARRNASASRFVLAAKSVLDEIGSRPERFGWHDDLFREAALGRFLYSVIYRVLPFGDVQVVAFAHASRDAGYWRDRVQSLVRKQEHPMTQAATELLQAVLALLEPDRSEVIDALDASLHPPAGLHPAWGPELRRPAAQLDSGEVVRIPHEEVMRKAYARLAEAGVTRE